MEVDLLARNLVFAGVMVAGVMSAAGWAQSSAQNVPTSGGGVSIPTSGGMAVANQKGFMTLYPALKPIPTPFPLDKSFERKHSLEFRAPEAMTAEDRTVADGAQAEIARRAELQGFRMGEGSGWGYEQAVCPAFPQQMILEYSRLNGPGDVSLFSAVVPRGSVGHVRVIPARRRGYSLWTPVASNSLTVNDFNHMVMEGGLSPDWLAVSLCYTAMAAGHVRAALVAEGQDAYKYPMAEPAMLTVSAKKAGGEVRLVDEAAPRPRGEWVFDFDAAGHLKRVRKIEPEILHTAAVQGIITPSETHGVPTAAP